MHQYIPVCTSMFCLVPAQYKVVQGGTRRYKVVQDGIRWYKQRYMKVHGGTRPYKNHLIVQAGTYWHVLNLLILTIQSGYAALRLDSVLQFCPADSAVLETTASNHTNASSSMFQSTAAGPAANLVTSPALIGGGRQQRLFFGGRGSFRRRGRRQCRGGSGSVGRGLDGVGVGVVRGYWHGITGRLGTDTVWATMDL